MQNARTIMDKLVFPLLVSLTIVVVTGGVTMYADIATIARDLQLLRDDVKNRSAETELRQDLAALEERVNVLNRELGKVEGRLEQFYPDPARPREARE